MADDDLLSAVEVAALLGIRPASWRMLVSRGYAPEPEGFDRSPAGRTRNVWRRSAVEAFQANRPGRGRRAG